MGLESYKSKDGNVFFTLKKIVFILISAIVIFEAFTYFFASALGFIVYFFTPGGLDLSKQQIRGLPFYLFFLFGASIPFPINVGDLFLTLWLVYLVCLIVAYLGPENSFWKAVKNPSKGFLSNYLFSFTLLANAALFVSVAIISLQESQGIPTGDPFVSETNLYRLFLILSYSPLVEELGFRIMPLGVMFLVVFYLNHRFSADQGVTFKLKTILFSFVSPESMKERLGVRTVRREGLGSITGVEWIGIIATSAIFGMAHYLGGWGIGKITATSVVGLILALSYVIYGIYAPILIHWFLNFYWEALYLSASLYPAVLSPFNGYLEFLSLGIGATFCMYVVVMALQRVLKKKSNIPKQ